MILGQNDNMRHIKIAVECDLPVLLIGDTGCGKTTMVQQIAKEMGKRSIRFNMTGETTVDEFVGKYVLSNQETQWQDGILLQAMKEGHWLIVDEINVALPEILFVLHSLLDDDRAITVAQHDAELVKPHKDFRFFGTMNPVEEYSGTKDLNKAFLSRFPMILRVEYPDQVTEAEILRAASEIDEKNATIIAAIGHDLRKAKQENKISYTCSTRDLIQWAKLVKELDLDKAFKVTIGNKAAGDQKVIEEIVKGTLKEFAAIEKSYGFSSFEKFAEAVKALKEEKATFTKEKANIKDDLLEELISKYVRRRARAEKAGEAPEASE